MANENNLKGTENGVKVEGMKKENIFRRGKKKFDDWTAEHPRIWKGIKIGGCVLGALGLGAGAYALGKKSPDLQELPDNVDKFIPAVDDVPELPEMDDLVDLDDLADTVSDAVEETVEA